MHRARQFYLKVHRTSVTCDVMMVDVVVKLFAEAHNSSLATLQHATFET